MNKIQRISHCFRVLFQIGFLAYLAAFVVSWGAIATGYTVILDHQTLYVGFAYALTRTTLYLLILFFLIQLFRAYEKNEIFTLQNVFLIRNIGYALLAVQIITAVFHSVMTPYWNIVGLDFIVMSILACMIILNSWIMAEGYLMRQEQQLTV